MPRAAPANVAFNAGELSPRMAGRIDADAYRSGCHVLENFIPDIAGPAVKRAGTKYVTPIKDQARRAWLVRFQLSAAESYILEFGHLYIRFFYDRAPVLSSGTPYEVVSPYSESDLINSAGAFALGYVQSGDIIYLTHRSHKPRKLSRLGATNWTLTEYDPTGGPFEDVNVSATTVYASAATGSITLHASAALFTTSMVGALFYLEQRTVSDVKQWETGKAITSGDTRRAGPRNYSAANSATTGTVTPTHTEGSVFDGDTGVQWTFLEAGFGWARIDSFTSSTQVSATVLSRIPAGAVGSGNPTTKWALGAWNAGDGYPETVGFYLDRLVFTRDQTCYMSVAGDYENMQARDAGGRQLTDSAIVLPIPSRRGSRILWQETLESGLVLGTASDEWLIGPASRNEPLGPLNAAPSPLGAIGSRAVTPLRMFDSIVFVQRSGKRLRGIRYILGEGAQYADMNAFADHITSGFRSLAYVAEPYSLVLGVGVNGDLSAATYYPEQGVLGWAKMPLTGVVESVQSIPDPDGANDELWLIVRRTINGATTRYVEILQQPLPDNGTQAQAFYVDSGISYSGAALTTLTGLTHLEGQTINLLVNGATHPPRTVSGGSVSLQVSGTQVTAGLPFTAKLATMDLEAAAGNGTAQAKLKRVHRAAVRLLRTLGGKLGTAADKVDAIQYRKASVPMGTAPPLFTGDVSIAMPGGHEREARVWFVHDDPLPATLVAVFPQMSTEDA